MRSPSKSLLTVAGVVVLTLAIYSLPSLVLQDRSELTRSLQRLVSPPSVSVNTLSFINSRHLAFNVEQVAVNDLGATLKRGADYAEIFTLSDVEVPAGGSVIDFQEEAVVPQGASIGYQISTDASHWFYFNGSKWAVVDRDCRECFNPAPLVAQRIADLAFPANSLKVKAALSGSDGSVPTLRSVAVTVRGELASLDTDQLRALEGLRSGFASASSKKDHKIVICHLPPGNPENAQTIEIDESAWPDPHQKHGDSLGTCPTDLDDDSDDDEDGDDEDGDDEDGDDEDGGCECDGKVTELTLRYDGNTPNARVTVIQRQDDVQVFDGNVSPGGTFSFTGKDQQGTLSSNITLSINGQVNTDIHTSCSQPIDVGMRFGDFVIVYGESRNSGPFCGATPPPPPPVDWDKSSLEVTGKCEAPDVVFIVRNSGEPVIGDMQGPVEYRIYRDNNIEETGTLQLAGGVSRQFTVPAHGDKLTMEVDQRPGHPGESTPSETVNFCGQTSGRKVQVCHVPPGNPENAHTIEVAEEAVADHLAKHPLDSLGACQAANRAPVAKDDAVSIAKNTSIEIAVLVNDSDPDGNLDPASLALVNDPQHGRAVVNITTVDGVTTATITYTPDAGFVGEDSFRYRICDSGDPSKCDDAYVYVTVSDTQPPNKPPVAEPDEVSTPKNTPIEIAVLANDYDTDGWLDLSSLSVSVYPNQGSVSINVSTGTITYTPFSGLTGKDKFKYQICDNAVPPLCNTAQVTVNISEGPVNLPPVVVDDTATTPRGEPVTVDVLANDSDPEGGLDPGSLTIDKEPEHGTVVITADYKIVYTPAPGYTGTDRFRYRVCDSGDPVLCDTAYVDLVVLPPANQPPVAADDVVTTLINTAVNIAVLANDSDEDGVLDPSTVTIISQPTHGRVAVDPASGRITYTPDLSYVGSDSFRYQVCDDDGLCDTATVSVKVVTDPGPHDNVPPVANDDGAVTKVNVAVDIDVLANDRDPDGILVPNTATILSSTPGAVLTVDPVTGIVNYKPAPSFVGTDSFQYQVCDNDGDCDTATVTVTVKDVPGGPSGPSNAPPVANDDTATTSINTPAVIDVLANDSDPDGTLDPASLAVVTGPSAGATVTVNSVTGQVTYTPPNGFTGSDTFTYRVCDNNGDCDTATVTVTVRSATNLTPPVANDDKVVTDFETSVSIDVLVNDFDTDGFLVASSLKLVTPPKNGRAVPGDAPGELLYVPQAGFSGTDVFSYEICDNDGLCDTADVSIEVATSVVPPQVPPPPAPPAPPLIPTLVLPAPPALVVSSTIGLNCNVPVYYQDSINFSGFYSGTLAAGDEIQYSLTNGNSWNPVETLTTAAAGSTFSFPLSALQAGEYSLRARVFAGAGAVSLASPACNFIVDTGLVFGANQFVLKSQPSPMTATGTIQFIVNEPQTFFLEAKGANRALVRNLDTQETFPLIYDDGIKLWSGQLKFAKAGFYRLEGEIGNSLRNYSREINSILVSDRSGISDALDGQPVNGVRLTVFQKNVETGEFIQWRGEAYAQDNPTVVNGSFSVILPSGDYYLRLERAGYNALTSLITTVRETSVVTASVQMTPVGGLAGRLIGLVTSSGTANNFPLQLAPAPETKLLPIGEDAPDFRLTDASGFQSTLLAELEKDARPTVLFVYSTWNTNAQVQIDIFNRVVARIGDRYHLVPVATMEPSSLKSVQSGRGGYGLDFFQPADDFYQKYYLTSLPTFLALNKENQLVGALSGRRSEEELVNWVEALLGK